MAMKNPFPAQEFCLQSLLQDWQTCETGDLLSALKKHWKAFVLVVFGNNYDQEKEDRLAEKFLFRPMALFLCNGEPEEKFKELREKDNPDQVCGRVFKMGEPTYSCRDCANDPTCVLCIDCFQKGVHKKHRYRMSTSGGGGYCDCGDVEAWKMEPFCDDHKPKEREASDQNPLETLPVDLTNRASALFMAALHYAVEMLTWEQCDNLPEDLQPEGELNDTYVTMLFNDEVHTYEQVINTLQRAVDCTHKQAVEFATTVDREGRSTVRTGNFASCEKSRNVIEHSTSRHGSKPLKVQVMHTIVVAHQQFAMKMIQWLQTIISQSDGLRRLFCLLSMQPQEDGQSLMEKLLLTDTQLWKVARVQSHQLMMAGVLKDQECKRQFSIIFTKWYPRVMHDFAHDDHDHDVCVASLSVQIFTVPSLHYSTLIKEFMLDDHYRPVSITSLSVQIFTVPTLARMLVKEHDLLNVIMKAFLKACEEKKNSEGKLAFDRSERSSTFKRACFMLYDLKYALICRPSPEDWCDMLRENFLKGLHSFLMLLKMMQGMDAVIRQTGMHVEYEPEWEGAFNLQLKQDDIISEFIHWCGTDKQVLIEAFKMTLEYLLQCKDKPATMKREDKTVFGHKTKCLLYEVSTQPVSIHLPLTRFLAGIYLHLEKFGLTFTSPELNSGKRLYKMPVDPVELIEPPLRVQVMIAQSHAGMWRRNGFALLNQIFFYHNVKCRKEMYDRDIVMLQVGAAVIESNEFIIHLLNKYGLLVWVMQEYDIPDRQDDFVRRTIMLAEEFLNLLVIMLGERYTPGVGMVTDDDVVKREIIHHLCIAPMPHSELTKSLPEDSNHETGIERVIHEVATFKKPTEGTMGGKGIFELKPECYKEYNPYFYHYSRAEQSKSEESQMKRKRQANEDYAMPPPQPPEFTAAFQPIINILQCDLMLHIMDLILKRTVNKRSRSWSEAQLDRVLHLIGLALYEQKRDIIQGKHSFSFLSKATTDDRNILSLLESLVGSENITHDSSKDLLTWVLKLFLEVKQMHVSADPVNMDTLDQLSSAVGQKSGEEKERKAKLAAKRRAKIMAQISEMQKNFIEENAELFETTDPDLSHASSDMDISEVHGVEFPVALGNRQSQVSSGGIQKSTCILCQEEQEITHSGRAMVLSAFVQRSTVLSQCRSKILSDGEKHDPLFTPVDLNTGTFTSSCGHVMHSDCWQRFFDAILAKERRRPLRFRPSLSYNVDQMEFLCPLCECISNTVIPLVPSLPTLFSESDKQQIHLSFNDWLDGIQKTLQNCKKEETKKSTEDECVNLLPGPLSLITKLMADSVAKNFQSLWKCVAEGSSNNFSEGMTEMMRKFSRDVYSFGLRVEPDDTNDRVPIVAWNTCAFTIQTTEQLLREEQRALFGGLSSRQSDCLSALIKFAAVCGQVASPDTVKQHCLRLLSGIMPNCIKRKNIESLCILDFDMFHYLTLLTMTLPTLYVEGKKATLSTLPSGSINDQHSLQLLLTVHLVQIMLTCDVPSQAMETEASDHDSEALLKIYRNLRQKANVKSESHLLSWQLKNCIKEACLPFLRCAAILFHHITCIPTPAELSEPCVDEFEPLCRYLALPVHFSELFENQGEIINNLINQWCSSDTLKERFSASSETIVSYPLPINHLIELPEDYSELINRVSSFTCPKSEGDDSRAPTMCLVCGKMLCSQSYCCQTEIEGVTVGAATEHIYKCGAGTGIFLRVRECQILLLAGRTKGCFVPPPYLDIYGETDQGLRRGNPLHLSVENYKSLQKLWFSHTIPETVAHNLESNTNLLTIDWQHL